ncbi:topoisomerase II-associated protein PAT1 [Lipomyces japonicus]|uniref:topoisomerase II-associated protein PAT1 n=1 Tax=Lipomyces japonicus TaxID=56871 RepID=UPI0034CEE9F8
MSFFGFDPSANPESRDNFYDNSGVEDAYDGLAEDLDEDYDALNDETFGDGAETIGRDFDFAGQGSNLSSTGTTQDDEKILFSSRRQQRQQPQLPQRLHESNTSTVQSSPQYSSSNTGNTSKYADTSQSFEIPDLKPMASLWESDLSQSTARLTVSAIASATAQPVVPAPAKKFLSLEEVEAQLLAEARQSNQSASPPKTQSDQLYGNLPGGPNGPGLSGQPSLPYPYGFPPSQHGGLGSNSSSFPPFPANDLYSSFNQQQQPLQQNQRAYFSESNGFPNQGTPVPRSFQDREEYLRSIQEQQSFNFDPAIQSQQQFSSFSQSSRIPHYDDAPPSAPAAMREHQPQFLQQKLTQPRQQLYNESTIRDETLAEAAQIEGEVIKEVKAARLSKYNGLMTASDKNHVTRLQLQQLITDDPGNEDFYYQVYTAIHKPQFAQRISTEIAERYLNEQGKRSLRRQQERIQRLQESAVANAKNHPRHEQYVVEGALGKISIGTAKGPRRVLDIPKKTEEVV